MNVSNPLNLLIKILVEKSTNQSASSSNFESTLHEQNCLQTDLTMNRFNSETSMRIRLRKKSAHERNRLFDLWITLNCRVEKTGMQPNYRPDIKFRISHYRAMGENISTHCRSQCNPLSTR